MIKFWRLPNGQLYFTEAHEDTAKILARQFHGARLTTADAHRFLLEKGYQKIYENKQREY